LHHKPGCGRDREFQNINIIAFHDVFHHRAGIDHLWWNQLHVLHSGIILLDDIDLAVMLKRQAQREGNPTDGRQ
jgi:hypothetical protein